MHSNAAQFTTHKSQITNVFAGVETDLVNSLSEPSIRVVMMPKDTNAHGTIFGGVILSYIDQAAAVEAKRHGAAYIVTVALREVVFHEPVYVGDLVSFYTRLVRIGKTSITVAVDVFSQSEEGSDKRVKVTGAEVTFVNLDENRKPTPIPRRP
jgi:acyl-CoA thioesterase YciA